MAKAPITATSPPPRSAIIMAVSDSSLMLSSFVSAFLWPSWPSILFILRYVHYDWDLFIYCLCHVSVVQSVCSDLDLTWGLGVRGLRLSVVITNSFKGIIYSIFFFKFNVWMFKFSVNNCVCKMNINIFFTITQRHYVVHAVKQRSAVTIKSSWATYRGI